MKETKLQELERRIKKLEDERIIIVNPQYPNYYLPTQNTTPPVHYHNGNPCYNNPCVWTNIGY